MSRLDPATAVMPALLTGPQMDSEGTPERIVCEFERELGPDLVADFDAWLPGHVSEVPPRAGFLCLLLIGVTMAGGVLYSLLRPT